MKSICVRARTTKDVETIKKHLDEEDGFLMNIHKMSLKVGGFKPGDLVFCITCDSRFFSAIIRSSSYWKYLDDMPTELFEYTDDELKKHLNTQELTESDENYRGYAKMLGYEKFESTEENWVKDSKEYLRSSAEKKEFIEDVLKFYGQGGLYASFFAKPVTRFRVSMALNMLIKKLNQDFCGDTFDREKVRDLMLIQEGAKDTEWFIKKGRKIFSASVEA